MAAPIKAVLRSLLAWLALCLVLPCGAEPYLALGQDLKCVACHVNPTGGGLRNAAGAAFSQYTLASWPPPDVLSGWNGALGDRLRIGGDLRSARTDTAVPGSPSQRITGLEQWRLYGDLQLLRGWVGIYLDEQLGPGQRLPEERYLRLTVPDTGWSLKAGQFYLPFGWRLQDNSAFVRVLSGINMTTPDKGVELGFEREAWSAQLAYSNGPGNVGTVSGHQWIAQVQWVQAWGRIGVGSAATRSSAGNRQASALFGGLHTGPLVWLGEIDLVSDEGYPEGRRQLLAGLAEVNWAVGRGLNLKFSAESMDPDRHVAHDNKARRSLVLEYTPLGFVQLRAGWRRYLGIPQSTIDNRRVGFVELHAMF